MVWRVEGCGSIGHQGRLSKVGRENGTPEDQLPAFVRACRRFRPSFVLALLCAGLGEDFYNVVEDRKQQLHDHCSRLWSHKNLCSRRPRFFN